MTSTPLDNTRWRLDLPRGARFLVLTMPGPGDVARVRQRAHALGLTHHRFFARARAHIYWSVPRSWVASRTSLDAAPSDGEAVIEVSDMAREGGVVVRIWRDALGRGLLGYRMLGGEEGGVMASSEIGALLAATSRHMHTVRLARALATLDRHDHSIQDHFEGVCRVLPGHVLEIRAGAVKQKSWWGAKILEQASARDVVLPPLEEQVRQFVEELDWAVERACGLGNVRPGIAVSSGLDSTLLAMRHHHTRCPSRARAGRTFLGTMSFPLAPSSDETARTIDWVTRALPEKGASLSVYDMSHVGALEPSRSFEAAVDALGAPLHPGERYEANFLRRFVEEHALDEVWTGVGADQLFDVHPLDAMRAMARHGQWQALDGRGAWGEWLGEWGVLGAWARVHGQDLWRALAPRAARRVRTRRQLESIASSPLLLPLDELQLDALAASSVEETRRCGEARRLVKLIESWEWEGLMRTLVRLEHAVGVPVQVPYLSASLWRWRALEVSADRCKAPVGSRLYNKYLLRCAHALFHGDDFPKGFAWRGKAAVFDEHIQRMLMGSDRDKVERLLEEMDAALQVDARRMWEDVKQGALGRPLVALTRLCAAQGWMMRLG